MISLPSGRKIGEGEPAFIVAEVGSNWRTLEDCLYSVRQAKACGADAVKFQAYTYEALYGISRSEAAEIGAPVVSSVPGTLPLDWLPKLKAEADRSGIEFMCSAFSPELIDAVDPFVNIHKVASAECTHKRMLERLRAIGKPVLLSTGAHGVEDIRAATSVLTHVGDGVTVGMRSQSSLREQLVLLYCVAAYPAREVDLYQIHSARGIFGLDAGYSDHTTDVETIPALAQSHGAFVIEKHVTFMDAETPDSPHSLTADEFKRMVFAIRGIKYKSLRTPAGVFPPWKGPTPAENPMVLRHNRRLIATRDIAVGDTLNERENFGIYRSLKDETHAFHPLMVDEVNGRSAKRAIKAGEGIGPGDT